MFALFIFILSLKAKQVQDSQMSFNKEFEKALNDLQSGNIKSTQLFFSKYYVDHKDVMYFRKKHIDYLISVGRFDDILKLYPDESKEFLSEIKSKLDILKSNDERKISKLFPESSYSIEVLKSTIKVHLLENNLKDAGYAVGIGNKLYPDDINIKKLTIQYYFFSNLFNQGLNILEEIGMNSYVDTFLELHRLYKSCLREQSSSAKANALKRCYLRVNSETLGDEFIPSIYTSLKYIILNDLATCASEHSINGYSQFSKILYDRKKDEKSLYMYLLCLLADDKVEDAKKMLKSNAFESEILKNKVEPKIRAIEKENQKKKEEEESRKQEEQKRRSYDRGGRQRAHGYGAGKGSDFLGYYKTLGVNVGANEKEIKKAYIKKLKEIRKRKPSNKDKKLSEEEHMKINKARDVLCNKKKRDLYDSGLDPDMPQTGYYNGGGYKQNQMFEEFGDFSDFFRAFSGFGGGQGGRYHRTQYVFF